MPRIAGGRRAATPLAILGLVATALAAWLLFPGEAREPAEQRPAVRALLVDASASATRTRPDWAAWVQTVLCDEARAALEREEEVLVVIFAAEVARAFGPASPEGLLDRLEGRSPEPFHPAVAPRKQGASQLARALELACEVLLEPDRAPGRLLVLGDRSFTGADPRGQRARLARGGVALEWIETPPASRADLGIGELTLPAELETGAPLAVGVELVLTPGTEAGLAGGAGGEAIGRLVVEVEGGVPPVRRVREVALVAPGHGTVFRWTEHVDFGPLRDERSPASPASSGTLRVSARCIAGRAGTGVEGASGDPVPENDHARAVLHVGEARVLGLVSGATTPGAATRRLVDWGRDAGLQVVELEPEELARRLPELDLLVTLDVAPSALPRDLVATFVRAGGGWFTSAGWSFLSSWVPEDTQIRHADVGALQDLLPLVPRVDPGRRRDVIFLVDGSGSMAGEPFRSVKEALYDLVQVAPPGDEIALRFFTGSLGRSLPLTSRDGSWSVRRRARALAALLEREVPGGSTAIFHALEELVAGRGPDAEPALVILLSDGKDREAFDIESRGARLRASFLDRDVRLVTIAVGADPDLALLGSLTPESEPPRIAAELSELGRIFQHEVYRERLREGDALTVSPVGLEDLPPGSAARDIVRAQAGQSWPTIRRYARAEPRSGALVLWRSEHAEPLLAMHGVGSGLVAQWTGALDPTWSGAAPFATPLFGPLLRVLARGGARAAVPRLSIETRGPGGRRELVLEGLTGDGRARIPAQLVRVEPAATRFEAPVRSTLSELVFTPGRALPGSPPLARRRTFLPEAVAADLSADPSSLRVELSSITGERLSLGMPLLRAPEFDGRPRRELEDAAADTLLARAGPRTPAPSRLAVPLLLLGLVSLSLATLAGFLAGNRPRSAG